MTEKNETFITYGNSIFFTLRPHKNISTRIWLNFFFSKTLKSLSHESILLLDRRHSVIQELQDFYSGLLVYSFALVPEKLYPQDINPDKLAIASCV